METGIPARLSAAEGRRFGLTVGLAILALGAVLRFRHHSEAAAAAVAALGLLLLVAGVAVPGHLGPVQRVWMGLARAVSWVTTPLIMGIVFFVVMTPIGLVLRAVGRRALKHPEQDGGYWATPSSGGRSDMDRQF